MLAIVYLFIDRCRTFLYENLHLLTSHTGAPIELSLFVQTHSTPHHTAPHRTTPHHTTLHHTTPHTAAHHTTTPHHITPHQSTPHHTTPNHYTILHHTTPHLTIPHSLFKSARNKAWRHMYSDAPELAHKLGQRASWSVPDEEP
jgi:hypothetical protein